MVVGTGGFATGITFCYWGWHVKGSCKDTVLVTAFITRSPSLQVELVELYTRICCNLLCGPNKKATTASLSSFLCSNFIWIFGTPWMSITSSRCWAWRSKEYTLQLLHGQGLNIPKMLHIFVLKEISRGCFTKTTIWKHPTLTIN